jgi:hypothetical protein
MRPAFTSKQQWHNWLSDVAWDFLEILTLLGLLIILLPITLVAKIFHQSRFSAQWLFAKIRKS